MSYELSTIITIITRALHFLLFAAWLDITLHYIGDIRYFSKLLYERVGTKSSKQLLLCHV